MPTNQMAPGGLPPAPIPPIPIPNMGSQPEPMRTGPPASMAGTGPMQGQQMSMSMGGPVTSMGGAPSSMAGQQHGGGGPSMSMGGPVSMGGPTPSTAPMGMMSRGGHGGIQSMGGSDRHAQTMVSSQMGPGPGQDFGEFLHGICPVI